MQKDFVAVIEEMNATAVDSIKRLGEIQLRAMERLTEQQIAITTGYLRDGVKQMQSVVGTKDLGKAFESQASYVTELNQRVVEDAQKTAAILADSKTELSDWVEEGVKSASKNSFAEAFTQKVA